MSNPKLRFKREDGTDFPLWKKEKWSNLGHFVSSGTLSKADLSDNGTPCILYGELYTKYGEIANTIYSKTNATSHIYSKADDVILPKSGETPEDISTATCVPYDNISLGGDLIVFRHNEKVIGTYLSYLISNRAKNAIASIAQGKSVVHISEKSLSNIELSYPCLEEQQKIADFLSTVDEVIAQSEAEVKNLEQQKKGAMQKIFSQEVRFKREDGTEFPEWEEKKIGAVFSRLATGLNPRDNFVLNAPNSKNYYVTIKNFEHGKLMLDENCDLVTDEAIKLINKRSDLRKNDILMSSIGRVGDCYLITSQPSNWNINESVFVLRPNTEILYPLFAFHTIHSDVVLNSILKQITGSTFKSIKMAQLKSTNMPIPCLEEQQKIADFLSDYDEAITYAKQELDKWKELKKGLLQQMFV